MWKITRNLLISVLIAALLLPPQAMAWRHRRHKAGAYQLTVNSALLMDARSHHVYFGQGATKLIFPASTTKILTAILVLENLPLDKVVTVSERATQVQPTKLDLKAGEQYTVRDLMYGLLLKSANDAAVVLAEAVAGSQSNFVDMMNKRARELGATHSHFANPHGLPSEGKQYTTAYDMSLIFQAALKNDFFRKAITFKYRIIYSKDGRRHFLKSHNKSLFLNWKQNVYGKTGYTIDAQSCFVGYVPKGDDVLIIAVFGCHKRWDDIKAIIERYGHIDL